MIFVAELQRSLSDCWFPDQLDAGLKRMKSEEVQAATDWVNNLFDQARDNNGIFNVTFVVPSDWGKIPLQALYEKGAGEDPDYSKLLYGNLVCRVGVQRPETWWSYRYEHSEDHHSRSYVLQTR
jgi:hypothetical protein